MRYPQRNSPGFTLIELTIVVAIIGILASMAVSAYQTYTVRAQVEDGLSMAANAKVPVTDAYTTSGTAPVDRIAAGMSADPLDSRGDYVSQVTIANGRIDVTFGGPRAHAAIVGDTVSLTPYETDDNSLAWRCGNAAVPVGGELLAGGADHVNPTVDRRYLPHYCR